MRTAPVTPLIELAASIRRGRMTSTGLVEECLAAIAERDDQINAFVRVLADDALDRARQADQEIAAGNDRGTLHGIPISVKDLIDVEGLPTTAASRVRMGHRAVADAPVVRRLREAGGILVGKCNLHEFAFGTTGEDSAFGPTRNPRVSGHMAGGSSSGSAASVAAGMALASVGTDTGGSIRIPAAACGVVGLKPTFGELSCDGVVPLGPSLDHVGPLARTVGDAAVVYHAMAGRSVAVGASPCEPATTGLTDRPTRLALPRAHFLDLLGDDVRESFENTLTRLDGVECRIDGVTIAHADTIATTYRHTVLYEAFQIHEHTLQTRPGDYSSGVRERLEMGRAVSVEAYRQAQHDRTKLRTAVDAALQGADALILPTLPIPAPRHGTDTVEIGGTTVGIHELTLRLTQLFDLTGHPALSLPCGTTRSGLPCAVQLVGHLDKTLDLLAVAARHEQVIGRV